MFLKETIFLFIVAFIIFINANLNLKLSSIQITGRDGIVNCDTLICPANSTKCTVWRRTETPATIKTIRKCFSSNETLLKNETILSDGTPNVWVNDYTESSISGEGLFLCSNCDGDSPQDIMTRHRQKYIEISEKMDLMRQDMRQAMSQMRDYRSSPGYNDYRNNYRGAGDTNSGNYYYDLRNNQNRYV